MDTDQLSCAKCGHLLTEGAETCAYCGTATASADSPPPPDENAPDPAAQAPEPSVVSSADTPPVMDTTEASSEPEPSSQSQPEETRQVIEESAAEAASGVMDSAPEIDEQIDSQLPVDERIVEFDDDTSKEPEKASAAEAGPAEIKKPETDSSLDDIANLDQRATETTAEVIPLAEEASAKTVAEDAPDLGQTPVLETGGEEAAESETLGADILELVEDEAGKSEPAKDQTSGDPEPKNEAAVDKKAGESPGAISDGSSTESDDIEAILLSSDDEVQSETPSAKADTEQAIMPPEDGEPLELAAPVGEGAAKADDSPASDDAQAKADGIQKQTDAQASLKAAKIEKAAKNKKAALAKAQVLKKKQLQLAKAQALKKKKLKLAKAQALEKQKEAQTGSAKVGKAAAIAANSGQSMEANTQLLALLKKYEGQTIGINYDNSADIKEAELVATNAEFFSVLVKDQNLTYCHPLNTILTVIEGKNGVEAGDPEQKSKFNAVVKVYPLVLF